MAVHRRVVRDFMELKYGEDPYMVPANLCIDNITRRDDPLTLDKFELKAGTTPSAINMLDANRLLQTATHIAAGFEVNFGKVPYIALVAKHGNVCGAGVGSTPAHALKRMVLGDRRAQFGGVILCNFPITTSRARLIKVHELRKREVRQFDTILAPGFDPGAVSVLERKTTGKCRFLVNPALAKLSAKSLDTEERWIQVRGGVVRQPNYTFVLDLKNPEAKLYGPRLGARRWRDLILAWAIGCTSNSNTITLVNTGMLIGNGVGQQDRVGAAELAIKRARDAGHKDLLLDAVAYSDSFFPFPDGPNRLVHAGIAAIFTSSGSINDPKTIEVCEAAEVALVMMPDKLCRGFAWH